MHYGANAVDIPVLNGVIAVPDRGTHWMTSEHWQHISRILRQWYQTRCLLCMQEGSGHGRARMVAERVRSLFQQSMRREASDVSLRSSHEGSVHCGAWIDHALS